MLASIKRSKSKFAPLLMAFLFLGTQLASTLAISIVNTPTAEAAPICVIDTAGANDESGQKDLTRLCVDYAGAPSTVATLWNWDETGTNGANTMDACNLFDTDGDGNINYAVCVTTNNNPAVLQSTTTYSCGDTKIDRCTSTVAIISSGTTSCAVSQQNTDPFPAGTSSPKDTQGACTIQLSTVGGAGAKLIDVCSYPSAQPNSDPSDCVIARNNSGKLEVVKNLIPNNNAGLFNLQIDSVTKAPNVGHNGTTGEIVYSAGNHTVGETAGTSTSLAGYSTTIVCKDLNGTGAIVAQATNTSVSVPLVDDADVICTVTNTAAGSITIVKDAIANSLQDFGFTTTGTGVSNFTLDDDSGVAGADVTNANTKVFNNISAGTYTFTEASVNGWYLDSINCPNIEETQNLGARAVSLTVTAGQNITCTFTNRQLGQIKVTKQTDPNNDPTQFAISASPSSGVVGNADQNITDDQTVTYTVKHGTYAVTETVPAGWSQASNNCSNLVVGGNTPLVNGVPTLTCTINNTKYSTLTFVKNAIPEGPQDFVFSATGAGLSGFILDDDSDPTRSNQQQFTNLLPGTYTGSEGAVQGWDLTNLVCTGTGVDYSVDDNKASVNLLAGQNITCTFTNTQRGSISGLKFDDLNGNGVWNAGEPTLERWSIFIDENDNGLYDAGEYLSITDENGVYYFMNLQPSAYSVFEVLQDTWVQTLSPADPINLTAGANLIDQNFGNFKNNTVSGYKWNDIDGNGQKGQNESNLSGWTINLYNDGLDDDSLFDDLVQTDVTDQDGNYSFSNVAMGTYMVCEVQQASWVQTYPANDRCHTIVVNLSGEVHSDTNFGNQGRGSVTIKKDVDSDGDGDVDYSNVGNWVYDINSSGDYATSTTQNVPAGTHTISEEQQTNYHFVSVVCDNQRQVTQAESFTLTVNPGDNITCSFTNARDTGKLKVIKYIDPSTDDGKFNLLVNGEVKASNVGHEGSTGYITLPTSEDDYMVSETAGTGTDLDDYTAEFSGDCDKYGGVTIAKDQTSVCYITNTKKAKITVVKEAYPYNDPQSFDFTFEPYEEEEPCEIYLLEVIENPCDDAGPFDYYEESDFTLDDNDGETYSDREEVEGLTPGTYKITELPVSGWDLTNIDCDYGDDNPRGVGYGDNSWLVYLEPGDDLTCYFTNVKRGSVTIVKDSRPNSDQEFSFEHNLTGVESENFTLVDDGENTEASSKTFTNVLPGSYGITEIDTKNWREANFSCDNDDEEIELFTNELISEEWFENRIFVGPGQNVTCTFVNESLVLNITKTNNKPQPTVVGDTVIYTLTVTVPEEASGVTDATVIDLPPENFQYVAGSWTANSSVRGNIKGSTTTEPTYASPGKWLLGNLVGGEVITLTYIAKILSNVTPGIYPDIAFVSGFAGDQEVLGNVTTADTPFVGTTVAVINPAVGKIFTAPLLANTGRGLNVLSAIIPALLIGLTLIAYRRSRQYPKKGGQL